MSLRPSKQVVGDQALSSKLSPTAGSPNGSANIRSPTKAALFATIGSLVVDLIAFTIILPLLPSIIQNYKKTDSSGLYSFISAKADSLGKIIGAPGQSETVLIGGVLGSIFCFLQFLSGPILGAISDSFGRRSALLICLTGICASHFVWLNALDFRWFVFARLLGGLSRANVSICTTIIADDSSPEYRPKGMAFIGGAFSIGFTVGPALGAYFAKSGDFTTPALMSFLLSVFSLLLVFFFVPETLPDNRRAHKINFSNLALYIWPPSLFKFKAVSTGDRLIPVGVAFFIYIFFYSGLEFTLTFLTHDRLKYTPMDQGKMFTFVGVTMTLLQGFLARRLTNSSEGPAAMFGIFIMIPAFIIIGFCVDSYQLYVGLLCYSMGSGITSPCLTSIVISRVPRSNEVGVATGTFRALGALARGFGPLLSAALFWSLGPQAAYVIGGIGFLIPLFVLREALIRENLRRRMEK